MQKASGMIKLINNGDFDGWFKRLYSVKNETQVERYIDLLSRFIDQFGDKEVQLFSAPGRSEVSGNHTDHNHGKVLACAVNLDNVAVVSQNNDNIIRVASVGFEPVIIDLNDLEIHKDEIDNASALVRGVSFELVKRGYNIGGFDALTKSMVPSGSGLSSSAAFEVLLTYILDKLYNKGNISPITIAQISQKAETNYFGKPCGLMDQTACAAGGFAEIDFADTKNPILHRLSFDINEQGFALCVVNTGGSHADLTVDYAAIKNEMASVAAYFGKSVLRDCDEHQFYDDISQIRKTCGDRAVLRAIHFFNDNRRVGIQADALRNGDFERFLQLVNESGQSSWELLQNTYSTSNVKEQGLCIGLAIAAKILHKQGAFRVHGGGFGGTIQAFVPKELLTEFETQMEKVFGKNSVYVLTVRNDGPVCLD